MFWAQNLQLGKCSQKFFLESENGLEWMLKQLLLASEMKLMPINGQY